MKTIEELLKEELEAKELIKEGRRRLREIEKRKGELFGGK